MKGDSRHWKPMVSCNFFTSRYRKCDWPWVPTMGDNQSNNTLKYKYRNSPHNLSDFEVDLLWKKAVKFKWNECLQLWAHLTYNLEFSYVSLNWLLSKIYLSVFPIKGYWYKLGYVSTNVSASSLKITPSQKNRNLRAWISFCHFILIWIICDLLEKDANQTNHPIYTHYSSCHIGGAK